MRVVGVYRFTGKGRGWRFDWGAGTGDLGFKVSAGFRAVVWEVCTRSPKSCRPCRIWLTLNKHAGDCAKP